LKMKLFDFFFSPFTDVNAKRSSRGDSVIILDGIRGLAVLIVLASHCEAFGMSGQGSLGVFLFFFLSGYVLTLPYVSDQRRITDVRVLLSYFRNRVLRIVPLYIILVLAMALVMETNWTWYLWNVSFIKGWNHLWSVAEEVRFYLLFPLVICVLSLARSRYSKLLLLSGLIWFSFMFQSYHTVDMMDNRRVQFFFYIFAGGIITCMASRLKGLGEWMKGRITRTLLNVVPFLCLLSLFVSSSFMVEAVWRPLIPSIPEGMQFNGWHYPGTWLCLFISFFFCLSIHPKGFTYRLLVGYPLRHIGLLSYSIYLSHMTILQYFSPEGLKGEFLFLFVLTATYVLALLTYIMIEKPFLKIKKRKVSKIAFGQPHQVSSKIIIS
jgi:peptidoglycan/LPS O-acetylase OafA/YrhL